MRIELIKYNKKNKVIGKESIKKFLNELEFENSKKEGVFIEVDLSGAKFNEALIEDLANIKALYNIEYINAGSREDRINMYVDTYYFLKKSLGKEGYVKWIINRIRQSDYPLMIMDNRFLDVDTNSDLSIIQPLTIKGNDLEYMKLRTYYTQPRNLEQKISENGYSDLWTRESIKTVDLSNLDIGIRFASNYKERVILDIIKDILEKGILGGEHLNAGV